MILFLAAQDISHMEAGLLDSEGRLLSFQEFSVTPEDYLATLAQFFVDHLISPEALEKIIVVAGPGSFTSSRIIVTIANALAFAKRLPIIGVVNVVHQNGEEMIRESGLLWVKQETEGFVTPVYDRPPHITIKKN